MEKIHQHTEESYLKNVLSRIEGKPVKLRSGNNALYQEPVPEPNKSKLLDFHKHLLTEELSSGRIGVLVGSMYRISIFLKHRPFEELTKNDVIELVDKIKNMKIQKCGRITKKER